MAKIQIKYFIFNNLMYSLDEQQSIQDLKKIIKSFINGQVFVFLWIFYYKRLELSWKYFQFRGKRMKR